MSNLRDRLKRIQEQKKSETMQAVDQISDSQSDKTQFQNNSVLINLGWQSCGFNVLKRVVDFPSPFKKINEFPLAVKIIIPDLQKYELLNKNLPTVEDLLFFDLETTGLSTGAGTIAFLAGFGRYYSNKFRITQYLLLDYSGQNDFLENIINELNGQRSIIVSYNGKTYDASIIKTMCLMNRLNIPIAFADENKEYIHADLLHPARRLWKNITENCSQASIETQIIGLDRSGDIPGALAPDIWFDFLKSGRTEQLMGICDHNKADICGLAQIFSYMILIAKNPFNTKLIYNIERLALYWRKYINRSLNLINNELKLLGEKLLKYAAQNENKKAVYIYSYDQMRKNNYEEALKYIEIGLKLFKNDEEPHVMLQRRKERLERKIR